MEKVRGFVNWQVLIGLGLCLLFGCNSADEETLEHLLAEPKTTETVTTEVEEPLAEPIEMLEAVTFTITLAIVPQSEKGWYLYTGPPTHWILPLEDRVFVVKAADGTFAKLRFVGYYKDNENKQDSGFVTFEYVHQPDGSPRF